MKAEILKVIGQLQYEISILDIDGERLTGVDIRTEELKESVKQFYRQQKYLFAEDIHQEKLLGIDVVTKRLNWMVEEMDKAKPFSQSYNNLNERHSRLLEAKKILNKEELWL